MYLRICVADTAVVMRERVVGSPTVAVLWPPTRCPPPYPLLPCHRALITPSPIPIVILCTKYDIFQDVERCVSKLAVC